VSVILSTVRYCSRILVDYHDVGRLGECVRSYVLITDFLVNNNGICLVSTLSYITSGKDK
jgi:hypothetical protein